jgi:predicted PurR-regulated permease PerM
MSSMRPPARSEPAEVIHQKQQRALGFLAIVAALVLARLALTFGVGLFLGALLAFTLQPMYGALRRRKWHAGPAALFCSVTSTVLVMGIVIGISILFISRSLALLSSLPEALAPGGPLAHLVDRATETLVAMHVPVPNVQHRLQDEAVSLGGRAAGYAAQIAGATFGGLLTFFFMSLSTFFVLRHWSEIVRRLEDLLPFERRHTHELLNQFRKVGRQVLLGTVVTGIIQGFFAAVIYEVTGMPEPGFWGVLTAIASLVPALGTLLVWVPLGIYKIMTGHVGAGLAELTLSALTVGLISDYLIRPKLVGSEGGVPTVLTFIALFGGVEVFGIVGLVLGPVLVTLSLATLRTYQESVGAT